MSWDIHRLLLPILIALRIVHAHKHANQELTEEEANAPMDSILWIHIFLQAGVWGILFPIGMVLGLSRSRWHVPLQVRSRPTPSHPYLRFSFVDVTPLLLFTMSSSRL